MATLLFHVKQKKRQQAVRNVSRETKMAARACDVSRETKKVYSSDLAVSRETVRQNTVLNFLKKINKFVKILLHSQKICGIILFV